MMEISIKAKKKPDSIILFGLLCLFFFNDLSSQIIQQKEGILFIKEGTTVFEKQVSNNHREVEACIYVAKGTLITNLQQNTQTAIIFIKHSEKENKIREYQSHKEQQIAKQVKEKKTVHTNSIIITHTTPSLSFFQIVNHNAAISVTPNANVKFLAFFQKQTDCILFLNNSENILFKHNRFSNFLFLKAEYIRPPPFS